MSETEVLIRAVEGINVDDQRSLRDVPPGHSAKLTKRIAEELGDLRECGVVPTQITVKGDRIHHHFVFAPSEPSYRTRTKLSLKRFDVKPVLDENDLGFYAVRETVVTNGMD